MPFKNFTSEVLTSSDVDTYLMRQTAMTFATTAARDSALSGVLDEGMVAYAEDSDTFSFYTGSAWVEFARPVTTYTPTWTNLTVGDGTVTARYGKAGPLVFVSVRLVWGSTTSISGSVSMSLPVTSALVAFSTSYYTDASPFTNHIGSCQIDASGTTTKLWTNTNVSNNIVAGNVTSTTPFTWTTGDALLVNVAYFA